MYLHLISSNILSGLCKFVSIFGYIVTVVVVV